MTWNFPSALTTTSGWITFAGQLLGALLAIGSLSSTAHAQQFEAWVQRFDPESTVLQEGNAVAIAPNGDVAVTGAQFIGNNEAYYTAKYAGTTGALLWEKTHDSGNGEDVPSSVAVDSAGNVIVTGYQTNAGGFHDFYTIKYASADGAVLWAKFYEGPNGGLDEAVKVVVDSADNVIVTGRSAGSGTGQDIHTLKYSASNGAVLNEWRYNSPSNRDDVPRDMVVDGNDNIIVVGEVNQSEPTFFYTGRYNGNGSPGAIHWEEVRDDLPSPSFYGALSVAVDGSGNVFTTGRIRREDGTFETLTIKYAVADGATLWDQFSETVKLDSANDPVDIAVDSAGNAIVGATADTQFGNAIYVVKYAGANGTILEEGLTNPVGDDDNLTAVAVDPFDNVVIAGTSRNDLQVGSSDDYFVLKIRGTNFQDVLFQDRRNGDNESGEDTVRGLAVDGGGNIVVTGKSRKPPEVQGNTFQMLTVKYGESLVVGDNFLLVVGDPAPGAGVPGSNVPEGATISTVNPPAVADSGGFATRVSFAADNKKKFDAIYLQDGAGAKTLPAVEDGTAPGVSDATFKSFSDPVVAPDGRFAFAAKLGGVKGSESGGVWTTAFNGTLQLALQEGQQVPGLSSDISLRSIKGISLRDGHLLSLIQIGGSGVNKSNNAVLLGQTSSTAATVLLRSGQEVTVGGETSAIRAFTVLAPAKGSGGQGRYHADLRSVARVTLADKRTLLVRIENNGTLASLLFTGQSASGIVSETIWNSFALPVIGSEGSNYAATGTLAEGDVNKSNGSVLVYSTTGAAFVLVAREGEVATDETGAQPTDGLTWDSLADPVVNDQPGSIAFLATLNGRSVKGSTKTALWFSRPGEVIKRVARLGDPAPDAAGVTGEAVFSEFISIALPSGTNAAPIFFAKIKGPGIGSQDNIGLWSVNGTTGQIRKLLGTGDLIGTVRITRLNLLQPLPDVQGATRSFNAANGVIAHLTLSDKRQALLRVDIP